MPQEPILDYSTICTIVGRLYLESQFSIKRASQEAGGTLLELQEEIQSKTKELELLKRELVSAMECIKHLKAESHDVS